MATLTEWPLPLNPPQNTPAFLQYLTPVLRSRLYYTKYIVDYIGELNVDKDKDNVREWKIPAALSAGPSGLACGISYSPDGRRVWFALDFGCRLVELNPVTGVFTAYGGLRPSGVRSQYPNFPMSFPRHIMFDGTGALWYTGTGRNGALIGRLAANRASARVWELPLDLVQPEGIWVEESGGEVWFTPIHSPMQNGAFLARLNRTSGRLTTWSHPQGVRPHNAGVAAEPRAQPQNVWFSYDQQSRESRVFRLHIKTGEVSEYPPVLFGGSPRKIAIDQGGNAWIIDWNSRVSRVAKNATCMLITLPKQSRTIRSKNYTVRAVSEEASPVVTSSIPVSHPVTPQVDGCYLHYPRPLSKPCGIAVVDQAGGPNVYYSDANLNQICLLTP